MDPMIKNSFFTILIYWNDNRIHLGLTKKLIFFIWFPPPILGVLTPSSWGWGGLAIWDKTKTYSPDRKTRVTIDLVSSHSKFLILLDVVF